MSEFEKKLAGEYFDGGAGRINHIRQNASNILQSINQWNDCSQPSELFLQLMGNAYKT